LEAVKKSSNSFDVDIAELSDIVKSERRVQSSIPSSLDEIARSTTCLNCGTELTWEPLPPPSHRRWLFCTEACQQEAKYVRYWRATAKDGRQSNPEVLAELDLKLAFVLGGGYPAEERRIDMETRQFVMQRARGCCQLCGGAGAEVDHIESLPLPALNKPSNLQLLCGDCHKAKTLKNVVPVESGDVGVRLKMRMLEDRCSRREPVSIADDEGQWRTWWQRLASKRRIEQLGR
jgi:5-methylcytosine-specific restriction endonuclease McrA